MSDLKSIIDFEDGKMILGSVQDCTPIAELAQAAHRLGEHGSSEMRHVAKIPAVIVEKYCNDYGITYRDFMQDSAHLRRLVNNPDNSHFRIWPGRV
jgi:hypothetical protein